MEFTSSTGTVAKPDYFMDINGSTRLRHRKTPSSDRLLGAYPHAPPISIASSEENELNEDDIFSTGDFSADSANHHHQLSSASSSSSSTPRHHHHPLLHHKSFQQSDSFGILAALPEHRTNPVHHHHLYQKTTLSSSSSTSSSSTSSARLIPSIPKPPQERVPTAASFSKYYHHQSAPVNVPVYSMATGRTHKEFDEIDEDEEEGDGEMLPPHEIVARTQSPLVACSVLEGVGRTLKGRDLRQVRNAVWRRTGFLD